MCAGKPARAKSSRVALSSEAHRMSADKSDIELDSKVRHLETKQRDLETKQTQLDSEIQDLQHRQQGGEFSGDQGQLRLDSEPLLSRTKTCTRRSSSIQRLSKLSKKAQACPGLLCSQLSIARSVIHATHSAHATPGAARHRWALLLRQLGNHRLGGNQ